MTLNSESSENTRLDWLKWLLVAVFIIGGLVANYLYSSEPWPLRLLGWILLLGVVVVIAAQTLQGKRILTFIRESRMELRKVVWPTRQETLQTTLFIGIAVVALAVFLWLIDVSLMWLIGWLTGQRG